MRITVLIFLIFVSLHASAQKSYFQQQVNYRIVATLDDKAHVLTGNIEMEYINRSPDTLDAIWMHLWPNAFKNKKTAFARQMLRNQDAEFYFSGDKQAGFLKNIDFTLNGQAAKWKVTSENPDIARIALSEPLLPGQTVRIATPYYLKIPASFSRLGHVETSYQMTQWFPKPAVYDRRGWHPMPYLDQGEFYSEFGNFDVTITLPDNYVVGATGILQTPSEVAFLQEKEKMSRQLLAQPIDEKQDTFPASSPTLKTLRYVAENVHDFAWFADKRFMVLKDTARLENGKTVDCWAMFTRKEANLWKKGAFYVRRAVEFYSKHIGEYAWPHATAVHSALSAGGGMEYPMITVIGDSGSDSSLDEVITHEVGHNWFYGMLATNERDHPYLDEGFNSYYEARYMKTYYGSGSYDNFLPRFLYRDDRDGSLIENGLLLLAREYKDTPPDRHSDAFSPLGYGLQTYMKPAWCLRWLEQSVGTARFDQAMKAYFRQWQFKHPYPDDVYAAWQSAGVDAPWFFDAMRRRVKADFKLQSVQKSAQQPGVWTLSVYNQGGLNAPFPVTALRDGKPVKTEWFGPQASYHTVEMEAPGDGDAFVIDYDRVTLDQHRKNNTRRTSGILPGFEPLDVRMLAPTQNPRRSTIGALPWVGANAYDGLMLGAVLYNPPVPEPRIQYALAPAFSVGSKSLTGAADIHANLYRRFFPKVTIGVSAKTFHFDYNERLDYHARFYRIMPYIKAELRDRSKTFSHALHFRALRIGREEAVFSDTVFSGTRFDKSAIQEVAWEGRQRKLTNPYRFRLALEWQQYKDPFDEPARYLRGTAEWKQEFYFAPKRRISARFFGGYFLQNTQRNRGAVSNDLARASFALNPQGFNDYRFDQWFLGRSNTDGLLSRQVSQTEGGFKGAFGAPFAGVIGNSNNFILAVNLKADLPRRLPWGIPLKPWFDVGYFDDATPIGSDRPRSEQLLWSGGLMLEFGRGLFEVYFPLANSGFLKNQYCTRSGGTNTSGLFCGGNYWQWISWSVHVPLHWHGELTDRWIR
jgi:hypothetical protein